MESSVGPGHVDGLRLASSRLQIGLLPEKGCDVVSMLDRESGTELLFSTPWRGGATAAAFDSQSRWLAEYRGGWQVLCPNAGPPRELDGSLQGFHGEAALVPWVIEECDDTMVRASVDLFTSPVRLEREIRLERSTLTIREKVINRSRRYREVVWMHHPAFGAPLVSPVSRLDLPDATVLADAEHPGTVLAPDSVHSFPMVRDAEGADIDLSTFPPEGEAREIFACLVDLEDGWAAIRNPDSRIGMALRWDTAAFPYAWLWQELHATTDFPWFERAYVSAIEPSTTLPGSGESAVGRPRGVGRNLAPGEVLETVIEATVFEASNQAVTHVGWAGEIETD